MLDLTAAKASVRQFLRSLAVPLCTQAATYSLFYNLEEVWQ